MFQHFIRKIIFIIILIIHKSSLNTQSSFSNFDEEYASRQRYDMREQLDTILEEYYYFELQDNGNDKYTFHRTKSVEYSSNEPKLEKYAQGLGSWEIMTENEATESSDGEESGVTSWKTATRSHMDFDIGIKYTYDIENPDEYIITELKNNNHKQLKSRWEREDQDFGQDQDSLVFRRFHFNKALIKDKEKPIKEGRDHHLKQLIRKYQIKKQHQKRLNFIKTFLPKYVIATRYVIYEIHRILRERIVKDELRIMMRILDKPEFETVRTAVLECFRSYRKKIPPDPKHLWNDYETNNLVINAFRDPLTEGVDIPDSWP